MPAYADTTDVLRELGGTERAVKRNFDVQLWTGDVTSVTVDGLTFDVPDTIITRIENQLEASISRIDGYILQAYRALPEVVPQHLRSACARLTAQLVVTTDGTQTEHIRRMEKATTAYLKDLAAAKFDLGITDPRPRQRRPGLHRSSTGSSSSGLIRYGRYGRYGRGGCC